MHKPTFHSLPVDGVVTVRYGADLSSPPTRPYSFNHQRVEVTEPPTRSEWTWHSPATQSLVEQLLEAEFDRKL